MELSDPEKKWRDRLLQLGLLDWSVTIRELPKCGSWVEFLQQQYQANPELWLEKLSISGGLNLFPYPLPAESRFGPGLHLLSAGDTHHWGISSPFPELYQDLVHDHDQGRRRWFLLPPETDRLENTDYELGAWQAWLRDNDLSESLTEADVRSLLDSEYSLNFLAPTGIYRGKLLENQLLLYRQAGTVAWGITSRFREAWQLREKWHQQLGIDLDLIIACPWSIQETATLAIERSTVTLSHWREAVHDHGHSLYHELLTEAVRREANDILLEPCDDFYLVRFKVNGQAQTQAPLTRDRAEELLHRIKILSRTGLRPTIRGQPQWGSGVFVDESGRTIALRLDITVTESGRECATIRLLYPGLPNLDELTMDSLSREAIDWYLGLGAGMFLMVGPTGHGKTTTLHAALMTLNTPERRIIAIEQPVERRLPRVVHLEASEEKSGGTTFLGHLRSVMRGVPDVLMIGEIRDPESAEIAFSIAMSGHPVLSTLHAIDCVGAISRLEDFCRVPRPTLTQSLRLVLNQRLVNLVCPHCISYREITCEEAERFPDCGIRRPQIAVPLGCDHCHGTGKGPRQAVAEVLRVDGDLSAALEAGANPARLREINRYRGFKGLTEIGAELAFTGKITLEQAHKLMIR